mgnify:FL=1
MEKIVLASASPRRRELLEQIGIKFDIVVSNEPEDEIDKSLSPENYTSELALMKACNVAKKLTGTKRKDSLIIAADTVVDSDGKILGKQKESDDAFRILKSLSGKAHEVYTGICVMRLTDGYATSKSIKTTVKFKKLTDKTIKAYIKTGEPADKAGAYGIQGRGAVLVEEICGDYFNVVGLPLSALYDVLISEFGDYISE